MASFDYALSDLPIVDKDGNTITDDNPLTLEDVLVRIIESTDPVLGLVTGDMLDDHLDSPYNWALLGLFLRDIFLQDQIDNIDIPDAVVNATTTVRGIIELATVAEAEGLADQFRAITPHLLAEALKGVNAQATTSKRGTAEIANQTEGRTGTNNDRIMTSLRVLDFLRSGTGAGADTTRKGTVQRATQTQVDTGTAIAPHLTPKTFNDSDAIQSILPSDVGYTVTQVFATVTFTAETVWHIGNILCIEITITNMTHPGVWTITPSSGSLGFIAVTLFNSSTPGWSSYLDDADRFEMRIPTTDNTIKFWGRPSGTSPPINDKIRIVLQTIE